MLRNGLSHVRDGVPGFLLNEVLSLNAQECVLRIEYLLPVVHPQ